VRAFTVETFLTRNRIARTGYLNVLGSITALEDENDDEDEYDYLKPPLMPYTGRSSLQTRRPVAVAKLHNRFQL